MDSEYAPTVRVICEAAEALSTAAMETAADPVAAIDTLAAAHYRVRRLSVMVERLLTDPATPEHLLHIVDTLAADVDHLKQAIHDNDMAKFNAVVAMLCEDVETLEDQPEIESTDSIHRITARGGVDRTAEPEKSANKPLEDPAEVDPKDYPGVGEDGFRRDTKIYELAADGWTNHKIVEELERLAATENWEPIAADTIRRCLQRFTSFTGKPRLKRDGRPKIKTRARKPKPGRETRTRCF